MLMKITALSMVLGIASCLKPSPPAAPGFDCANRPTLRGLVRVENPIKDRYVVVLKQTKGVQSIMAQPSGIDRTRALGSRFKGVTVRKVYDETITGFSATIAEPTLVEIIKDPEVQYISQEGRKTVSEVRSWGIDRIDQRGVLLDGVYAPGVDGSGVVVAVIDTGVKDHIELLERLLPGFSSQGGTSDDKHGHGTHVAATIGGTTVGVAPGVKILPVRVLGEDGSGSDGDVIAGVEWAVEWFKAHPEVKGFANMSLGGGRSAPLDESVCDAIDSGLGFAIAAGNEDRDADTSSPARVRQAITVGATTVRDERSEFSNWGELLDIFAPGSDILSASLFGGYERMSGTSMASPHVAGAAALYLQRHPDSTPQQVRDGLVAVATGGKLSGVKPGSPDLLLYVKEE